MCEYLILLIRKYLILLWFIPIVSIGGCTSAPQDSAVDISVIEASPLKFSRTLVDSDANGPAFAAVGDLNGDGRLDFTISQFGQVAIPDLPPGEVVAYLQGDDLKSWEPQSLFGPYLTGPNLVIFYLQYRLSLHSVIQPL